ncbi:hypothetical protein Mpet_2044 [Methanolacinia petrolearia DSM 11571]|uniref:Uncharacterized protein n=2 Tax=Methanolacinia TaxID=230355 RepID=E1RJI6_METP4|nr:hypothetical protein Mpet_2044 [Methanolacinia petrolearia DSM 11571]
MGFSILVNDGKVEYICDSDGREKSISAFEDLIEFLTNYKYLSHLCCFYCSNSDFISIINHLSKKEINHLLKKHEIDYYKYKLQFYPNKQLIIRKPKNIHYFFNLHPFFREELKVAMGSSLDYDIIRKNQNDTEYYKKQAVLVKKIAEYYTDEKSNFPQFNLKVTNEPQTDNYFEIGTAFDYLLRFKIEAENENVITQPWVAYNSLYDLNSEEDLKEKERIEKRLAKVEKVYRSFLKKKIVTEKLIKCSLDLTKLDSIYRAGYTYEELDFKIDSKDIEDLDNLISGVPEGLLKDNRICILNPTFGLASYLIRGADADLYIDNTLIDIKTTKNPDFSKSHFYQLLGYVLLHNLGQKYMKNCIKPEILSFFNENFGSYDMPESTKIFLNETIERIGIYFSRSNYLYTLELKDIVNEGKFSDEVMNWFENECYEYLQAQLMNEAIDLFDLLEELE